MSITVTLTDPTHIFGATAAAAAASTPAQGDIPGVTVTPQEYVQRILEGAATSWAQNYGFVAASIPLDRAMALGQAKAEWNATAPQELQIEDESDLSVKAAQFALENRTTFEAFLEAQ